MLIGTAVQNSLIGDDVSLLGGLILATTLIALNYAVAALTARSGEIYEGVLRQEQVSEEDFNEAMRRAGCRDRDEVEFAFLESQGHITVMRLDDR